LKPLTRRIAAIGKQQLRVTESIMKGLMIFVIGAYTVLMFASLVFAQASAGKLTFEKCSPCHGTARLCEKLGARTPEVWGQTVERMRGNGAQLTDDDAATIAEYLATAKAGDKRLCKPAGK
jgi:cytochrome c553